MAGLPEIRARSFDGTLAHAAPVRNLLSRSEQEKLERIATLVVCKRGTNLCPQGEQARFVYLIAEGIVRINRCDDTGHRQIMAFVGTGDLCGVPCGGCYFSSAETVSATKAYRFEWQKLQQLLASEPHLQSVLFQKVFDDYCRAQVRMLTLGQQNAYQRLASFILDFVDPLEHQGDGRSFSMPISRADLADYLGIAPESTARAFAKLESLGLIRRTTPRSIQVLDVAGLRTIHAAPRRQNKTGEGQENASRRGRSASSPMSCDLT